MYKEALERVRRLHDRMLVLSSTDALVASSELEFIFPELRESEDERMRKELIEYHKRQFEKNRDQEVGLFHKNALAYLEKQEIFSKNGEGCYYYHADGSYTFIGSLGFGPIEDTKLNGERPKTDNNSVSVDLPGACPCVEKRKESLHIPETCKENANSFTDEDERIRKTLVEYFGPQAQLDFVRGVPIQKIRVWLEKQKEQKNTSASTMAPSCWEVEQKEQKPVEPSDDELQRHQDELYDFKVFATKQAKEHHISFVHDFEWNNFCAELLSYFNEQKPEWSEEDEKIRDNILRLLSFFVDTSECDSNPSLSTSYPAYQREIDWLKSLRPSWKPSKEQMEALRRAVNKLAKTDVADSVRLSIMYDNLKKL